MSPRIRKLVGTVLLLVVLAIYSLLLGVAASAVLTGSNKFVEMIFYAIAGLAWVVPAGYLIRWMYATPR
jgi:uncharacterized membrane protein YuzA (DUF378 family)